MESWKHKCKLIHQITFSNKPDYTLCFSKQLLADTKICSFKSLVGLDLGKLDVKKTSSQIQDSAARISESY